MENPVHPDWPDGLELFETMGFFPGEGVRYFSLHLDRLCASCRAFNVPFDRAVLQRAVRDALGDTAVRMRLSLGMDGTHRVDTFEMPQTVARWRLGLADARIEAGEVWRRHKTTHRALYDAARAALPPGTDEVLFLNQAGDCAEGTITNLFVDPGAGALLTPPLSAGVLPGVLRRHLIDSGQARVARVTLPSLKDASGVFMGNALRGLMPVTLDIPSLS